MKRYQKQLTNQGLTPSMSRRGNCLDNACIESFFGVLKSECFYRHEFVSIEELEETVREYIYYYNNNRIKVKLNGLSPVQFRRKYLEAA